MVDRIGQEEIDAVLEVMRRDPTCLSGFYKNFNGGPSVQQFEQDLADYNDVNYAVTCSNGTAALHLALMAAEIGPTDMVAVPPLTFSATATAVLMQGAAPFFVDVEQSTWCMSPERFRKAAAEHPIRAVIVVNLLGVPAKLNEIKQTCDEYDIIFIEDNAQALGARFREAMAGGWGDLSTISLQETKVITSLGEGGAVLTNEKHYMDRIKSLRNHGQQYPSPQTGVPSPFNCWNYRMTEAQAAMGAVQLKKLDLFNAWHVENRKIFIDALRGLGFTFQEAPPGGVGIFYILGTTYEDSEKRHKILKALHEDGWGEPKPGATIGLGYTKTIMELPLLRRYRQPCPVADWLCDHGFWFDVHRWMHPERFKDVAMSIRKSIIRGLKS